MPRGSSEQIAATALAEAFRQRCRGGSWQGLARELAWRAVTGGNRDPRTVEMLAAAAEELLAARIDRALWEVERTAFGTWEEHVEEWPADDEGALAAARLDAGEEAVRLIDVAYDEVLDSLLARSRRAA